jgi:UDP:flavonoid glycosyltransferase YjiC (YdhE family)
MAILGAFCFPGTGHLNPMTALARRLQQRGHRVIIFGIADTEARVRSAGVEFQQLGQQDYPLGTLLQLDQKLSRLKGLDTFRFTVERVKNHSRMVLRDGPAAVKAAGVEALLVDEADMAGSVAEFLRLPFVSIACFPPLLREDTIPPFCFGWPYSPAWPSRLRNRLGAALLARFAAPIFELVNGYRKAWELTPLGHPTEALSPIAQITQLPQELEFPLANPPSRLHYTGPFMDGEVREPIAFPWEQLDGRPLVYGSMGTLQNGSEHIFQTIAEACCGLDAQLVLSMGGRDPAQIGDLPGHPVVVRYAPQLQILKRAAAVITHAGLNTTLESLTEGVPLVAIPLGNDQPGVAARIAYHQAGIVIPLRKLRVNRLRGAIDAVLRQEIYRSRARRLQAAIQEANGLEMATDVIENSLGLRGGLRAQ